MATSTYLSNPVVLVNSVDLTNQCTAATLTRRFAQLDATSFGDTSTKYTAGLQDNELTLTLYMSYAASETYATLQSLVGTTTTVRVQPAAPPDSATNPGLILTGCFLAELPVLNATMSELSTIDITFTGGVFSADTTAP
jgi:hypothetical protein